MPDDILVWEAPVNRASEYVRAGDFVEAEAALAEALKLIEAAAEDDDWKVFNNGRACDEILNTVVKLFYEDKPEELEKYFGLCMLVAIDGRFESMHQSQFTLVRLFDMAAQIYMAGFEADGNGLVAIAFHRYAKAFSPEEATLRLEQFCRETNQDETFFQELRDSAC